MENGTNIKVASDKEPGIGIRHLQVFLLFLLLAIGVGMRSHLPVAIVAMTDNSTTLNSNVPVYNWTNKNVILSSYFWGYGLLQMISGELGRNNTKYFLIVAMFINATVHGAVPLIVAYFGSHGLITVRVVQGMSQGVIYPCIYNQLGKWAPVDERSRLSSIALSGSPFGTIVTMPIVGYISSSFIGWPFTFYLYGVIGYIWIVLWFIYGAESPAKYRKISEVEKNYIESSLQTITTPQKRPTPWRAILKSLPVWAITVSYFGQNWGYTILSTEMPSYLHKVMKFNMQTNGLLSSLPFIVCFILSFFCSSLADYLINKSYLSRGTTRKVFTTVACIIPTVSLLGLCYIPDDAEILSVVLLILPISATAAQYGGSYINHIDLSPNFAGILLAISNTIPNLCSIFGPIFVHFFVSDETDKSQWRMVFITSALLYLITDIFYIVFASGKVQPWNNEQMTDKGISQEKNASELKPLNKD